jgi:soluble lytic murein transglycosylase-like protein
MDARPLFFTTLALVLVGACSNKHYVKRYDGKHGTRQRLSTSENTSTTKSKQGTTPSERCESLLPLFERASRETGMELALLVGLVRVESNFRNDVKSSAGARGLTQVMDVTAKAYKCESLDDPYENIVCGARVLKSLLKACEGNLILALSAYNAGLATIKEAKEARSLPVNMGYVEGVLWSRSRFLLNGCDF